MIPSELRKKAREALAGNWGKGAYITLSYLLITFLIGIVMGFFEKSKSIYSILYIADLVISIPLSFGLTISFLKLKRNEETKSFGFLSEGFSRFSKAWSVFFQIILKMILPIICIVFTIILMTILLIMGSKTPALAVLGVVLYMACIVYAISRALLYSLSYYIAYDDPNLSAKECVSKSESFMKGNRGNLLLLELSFIGWMILGALTLGIGYIWLVPYLQVTIACFYDEITSSQSKKVDGKAEIEIEE